MNPKEFSAPFLSRDDIKSSVDQFIDKYGNGWSYPLDVELLAEDIGFNLRLLPHIEEKYEKLAILSHSTKDIIVEESLFLQERSKNRYRFSIAHELGHFVLHSNLFKNTGITTIEEWAQFLHDIPEDQKDYLEAQANKFAAHLLIPQNLLIKELTNYKPQIEKYLELFPKADSSDTVSFIAPKLAPKYGVSEQTMEIRINNSNIIDEILNS